LLNYIRSVLLISLSLTLSGCFLTKDQVITPDKAARMDEILGSYRVGSFGHSHRGKERKWEFKKGEKPNTYILLTVNKKGKMKKIPVLFLSLENGFVLMQTKKIVQQKKNGKIIGRQTIYLQRIMKKTHDGFEVVHGSPLGKMKSEATLEKMKNLRRQDEALAKMHNVVITTGKFPISSLKGSTSNIIAFLKSHVKTLNLFSVYYLKKLKAAAKKEGDLVA